MGSLASKGRVYEPIENMDLSADSKEPYMKAEVKAPRMDGLLIRIFVWSLELKLIGSIMLYILKEMNLIHKLFTHVQLGEEPIYSPSYANNELEEKEVKSINFKLPTHERVRQAFDCLPQESSNKECSDFPVFQRWSIKDFSRAYLSGETTPLLVAERFIAAVRESSKPPYQMSFFINYDCDDILRQATISTSRYQKGTDKCTSIWRSSKKQMFLLHLPPAYPIQESAMKYGELDYVNGAALVRYQIAGNFLGLPAITVPVGYDNSGMPIGLQFIGRPWSEATLLHLAYAVQSLYIKSYRKPMIFYDLLPERATSDVSEA